MNIKCGAILSNSSSDAAIKEKKENAGCITINCNDTGARQTYMCYKIFKDPFNCSNFEYKITTLRCR